MKNLFTLLFVFFLYSANAANYYFSSVSGDDSRSPAQAGSASAPWKTLGKLNSFFSNLQPGDSVLLKRGETFYGSITVNKSGTLNLPIIISAYGIGNRPVITSLVTLYSWASKGNGVWESYNPSLSATVNTVLINNTAQELGRYPNSDVANKGFLTLESHTSNSITDNELASSPNWTGAEIVLRLRRWVIDRCPITNHTGSTLTYTPSSSYAPNDDYGYFIQNDIKTLDKFGEWYYDPSLKKLSVYFGANAPSSYVVQATSIDNLISSSGYSYVVFDNVAVKGANTDALSIKNGNNINIKNCDIIFSGGNGLTVRYHDNLRIENCTITNSNNNGIDLGYSGDYAIIRNNKITNTSIFSGMGGSGDNKGFGIFSNGYSSLIEYNEITNTGYIAINFNGDSTVVKNNFIDTYCLTKDDGSGIYTYTGPSNITKYGRKVVGNIIVNGIGSPEGINDSTPAAEGIYLDDNSSGVEISNNTIANMPDRGLYLNNARNLIVNNNTFYNMDVQFYAHQYRKIAGAAIRNLNVKQNIFFSKNTDQTTAYFTTEQNDNGLIGTFDSNYYARPIDDRLTIFNSYIDSTGARVNENLDLEGWKKKYNLDASSKRSSKQIAGYRLNSLTSSNKVANGTFTSNINGVLLTSCTIAWGNSGQLDGGYLEVTPSAKKSAVYLRIGGLTAGKKYLVRYSVKSSGDGNMTVGTFLRKDGYPYNNFTAIQSRKLSTARTDNEMLFLSATTETAATVFFNVDNQIKYYLDNIQVYEADATITDINDSLRFEYNATSVSKTVSLAGNYVDVKNHKYSNSIVLQPYTSAVLIKDGGAAVANAAPSVSIISPDDNSAFAAPASITINAIAADSNGTISKVEFYNGSTLLGTDTASPYIFTWNNVPAGNYSITAKATDNGSLTTTSDTVAVSVFTPNVAPSVSIASPGDNTTFAAPATIIINAAAADTDGTVNKVEFYNGSTLLGTDTASPYIFTWSKVPAGNYSITAKATDNGSLTTTSDPVSISVYTPNVAPSVSITSPAYNATFAAPASITINAAAADADGNVSKVEFYNGTTLLGTDITSPYVFTWNNVPAGDYSITAKATDNGSLTTTSDPVSISVYTPNVAPSVSITSPADNATFTAPASITINAAATDTDGTISKVEFYNGNTLLGTDTAGPYTFIWNNIPAGNYSITAKATDNGSLVTVSNAVSVTVLPNIAPVVAITSPAYNATFAAPASITINAAAADADGNVSKVEFYNGTTLLGTDITSPYVFTWNNVPAGDYSITAKATDNGSLTTTSDPVSISVYTPNVAPSVSITSPADNATFTAPASITINAAATDTDGTISKVEFYNGNTLLGTDTASPYVFTWNNVPAGNYSITAKATDNGSLVTVSKAVSVTVLPNIAPVVAITSPVANTKFNAPATVFISAAASDADGAISKVEFYIGTTLLHVERYAPYTYSWTNVPVGTYTIIAKATDNKGAVTNSASVTVSVAAKTVSSRPSANNGVTGDINNRYTFNSMLQSKDEKVRDLKIFPNPAVSKIQISIDGVKPSNKKAFLNIQNISGITLKIIPVIISGKTIEADISFLRPGIYIISLISDNLIISRKFIKN